VFAETAKGTPRSPTVSGMSEPDGNSSVDDAISAGLDGHTVAVADPGALGQDVVVDPSIDGTTLATLEQSADD